MIAFIFCLYFSSLHVNILDDLHTYGIGHVKLYHTLAEFYNSLYYVCWGGE